MGANRKARPDKMSGIFKLMTFIFRMIGNVGKIETFKPDIAVDEDFDLSAYEFMAIGPRRRHEQAEQHEH